MAMLAQLWLPIVLSAVGVFVASSLIHMLFKWHNRDYRKLPNEDAVRAAINAGQPAPACTCCRMRWMRRNASPRTCRSGSPKARSES